MLRILLTILLTAGTLLAQQAPQHETALGGEFRLEGDRFHDSCVQFSIASCADLLFTDHPLHIAVGSIAPQNGFGSGLALVTHSDFKTWLFKSDTDVIGTANGSWRVGTYMKIIPTTAPKIQPHISTGQQPEQPLKSHLRVLDRPLFTIYAQAISLTKLDFFGLGPGTSQAGRSFFGMRETITGGNAIVPIPMSNKLNLSFLGEMNGRFVSIRGDRDESSPSIEQLYTPVTAPGLATQPGFIQFGEGLRMKPVLFAGYLRLNYLANLQQFVAPSNSSFSFRRFTADLSHQVPLYRTTVPSPKDANGPDECGTDDKSLTCPSIKSISRNRYGTLDFRFLLSESIASSGSVVPFYFDPTLGGADINGSASLSSYQDYRFRGPDVMLFHAGLEHSIFSTPVGFIFGADAGKVALTRGELGLDHLSHSFSTGLTLRAGGFPQVFLLFAWGGQEGTHTIGSLNTSLLGGSIRPSLY
ncbi:MAG TPA: hypothetical protein VIX19_10460 [Terriglobales bacterium]